MSHNWPVSALADLLIPAEEQIDIQPAEMYKQITVRFWGKGVVLRGEVSGGAIATTRSYVARPEQFIMSRIDARHGAFGLVPDSLDGAIVTNDFPLFEINKTKLLPEFLAWVSKTHNFVDLCRRASEGTTNRVRLKVDRLLNSAFPLPPLDEQRRIVARIEALATRIAEARGLRQQAVVETSILVDETFRELLTEMSKQENWKFGRISEFAEVNPSRQGKIKLSADTPVTFVPMVAVDEHTGTIKYPEIRPYIEVAKGYTWFQNGDVIFARITPCMQNGKTALAQNLSNNTGFGSTEFHVLRPGLEVLGAWLHALVRQEAFRKDAASHFKGTAGQQRVPEAFFLQKVIPIPPISEQHRIVAYLDDLHARVAALKRLQAESAAELDALLPALLDRALRGEL